MLVENFVIDQEEYFLMDVLQNIFGGHYKSN